MTLNNLLNNIRKRAFGVGLTTVVLSLSGCGTASQKSCESDNDCPGQQLCVNNTCSGAGQTCNNDFDCAGDEYCVNNFCTFNGQQSCETDFDCSGDSVCEDGICSGYSSASIPDTTKIIDDNAASSILDMSNDKSTLTFSSNSTYAQNLKQGDVIVAGVYDNIPVGLLRKVTSKSNTGSEIIVNTKQATLEDAVENGIFEGKIAFTPEYAQRAAPLLSGVRFGVKEAPLKIDYSNAQVLAIDFDETELYNCKKAEKDNPNDPKKKCYCDGCKVVLDGSFEMGVESEIKIDISWSKLNYAKFALTGTEALDLTLSGEFAASIETDIPEVTVATFPPIVLPVTVAGFPVVVVPSLSMEFGLKAEGELSLQSSVSQSLSATYGVEYQNKNWSPIKNFDYDFDFVPPTLTKSGATARAYVKPKLNFDLYAINGPYAGAEASISGEVYPQEDPWCSLTAGLWVGVGFEAEVLGHNLIDYKNTLYEYEKELYTCGGGYTCTDDCSNGETKCYSDGFKVCDDYNGDGCVEWGGVNYCDSDEYCDNGGCVPEGTPCTDECSYTGEMSCSGNNVKECGYYDGDDCLEWTVNSCGSDYTCESGECVYNPICTSDCSGKECGDDNCGGSCGSCSSGDYCDNYMCVPETTTCTDECDNIGENSCIGNSVKVCAYRNADDCLDLAFQKECGSDEYCNNGECVSKTTTCTDECDTKSGWNCTDAHTVAKCSDSNGDGCLEFITMDCGSDYCVSGYCVSNT